MILSIAGLPGAGKTTLAHSLSREHGWHHFELGRSLREHARCDLRLKSSLDQGNLAPEHLVEQLISAALHTLPRPLILDGFPRHAGQLPLVRQAEGWHLLLLSLPIERAVERLRNRRMCANCGALARSSGACSACGSAQRKPRAEDMTLDKIAQRIEIANQGLPDLLRGVDRCKLLRVDASLRPEEVLSATLQTIGSITDVPIPSSSPR